MNNQDKTKTNLEVTSVSTTIKAVLPGSESISATPLKSLFIDGVTFNVLGALNGLHEIIIDMKTEDGEHRGIFKLPLVDVAKSLVADFKRQIKEISTQDSDTYAQEPVAHIVREFNEYYPIACCNCGESMRILPSAAHRAGFNDKGLAVCRTCRCPMSITYDPDTNSMIPKVKVH